MKTRKSLTPKSAGTKKTPPAKKTPQTRASEKATKDAATPKTPATPTSEPMTEASAVHETGAPSGDKTAAASSRGPAKKVVKCKSPLSTEKTVGKSSAVIEKVKKKVGKVKALEEEANVGVVALKSEAENPTIETEELKKRKGHVAGENADEHDYEDVVLNEHDVSGDDKNKIASTSVKSEEEPMINNDITEDSDESQDDIQEHGDGEFMEEEEMEDVEEDADEGAALHEEFHIEISDMAKQRKSKKENEVFVGGLDRDAVEEDVKKAFEEFGEVVEVRLHKDFVTNKNKGFAFVKFSDKRHARRVLAELKNPIIRGKRCGIAPSEDNDTLFLGNICNTWTKEAVKRKLQEYEVEGIENVTLVGDTQNDGLSRGFAFIEFSCHVDAMNAYKRLQKPDVIFGHPKLTAKVAFAEPLREPDAEIMSQVKSVFVDGLPPYWDEDCVKEKFKVYGDIERVVLARNMSSAKRNDFGFVNFTTPESAVACVEGVNNTELGDGKSKTTVRARLANPLPKAQAVKGGISGGFLIGQFRPRAYSRFGRGFGRGRYSYGHAGFLGGRGFHSRGRGRVGGFPFPNNNFRGPFSEFNSRHPFRGRGGRSGVQRSFHEGSMDEFSPRFSSARRTAFSRGPGNPFHTRRQTFPMEGDFGGPPDSLQLEDPYLYGNVGHSTKRSFSMLNDPRYSEPVSSQRPRYDYDNPLSGPPDAFYPDYSGSDFRDVEYPSLYGGQTSGGGYYY